MGPINRRCFYVWILSVCYICFNICSIYGMHRASEMHFLFSVGVGVLYMFILIFMTLTMMVEPGILPKYVPAMLYMFVITFFRGNLKDPLDILEDLENQSDIDETVNYQKLEEDGAAFCCKYIYIYIYGYICFIYVLYMFYICFIYVLYMFYICFIYVLYMFYICFIYVLYVYICFTFFNIYIGTLYMF